jgi:hypothetical protein
MPEAGYRFRMASGVPVITAPAEIDVASAAGQGPVADTRACEQCGRVFVPLREHARFCGVGCRAAWNGEHLGDPAVEASALQWSVTAMSEATGRLPGVRVRDQPQALAAISEAVWWVTMVDATLVRHHREAYDAVLAAGGAAERRRTEATLAGLRFARNWIGRGAGLAELIDPEGAAQGRVTGWTWKPASRPELGHLPPRGQAWEMARYRAYRAGLAGRTIGKTFRQAVTFLALTGANATASTMINTGTRPWQRSSPARSQHSYAQRKQGPEGR